MNLKERIWGAVDALRARTDFEPEVGLILGSGLGDYAERIKNPVIVNYQDIPGFPVSSVEGHKSRFVMGEHLGKRVIAMPGEIPLLRGIYPAGDRDSHPRDEAVGRERAGSDQRGGRSQHEL